MVYHWVQITLVTNIKTLSVLMLLSSWIASFSVNGTHGIQSGYCLSFLNTMVPLIFSVMAWSKTVGMKGRGNKDGIWKGSTVMTKI